MSICRQFTKYVSFSIFSMLGLSLYVLADTFFIAQGIGSDGLTALNLVLPVYSLMNGLGLLLGMGGATRYSIFLSEGRTQEGNTVFSMTAITAVLLGVLFLSAGLPACGPLVQMLGADAATSPLAESYLKTIFSFAPGFLLNNVMVCFIRNDKAPNLSMAAMLTASASNIVLDYVFIFPFEMGMFGAALATGLAPVFSLCVLSSHFLRKKNRFRPTGKGWNTGGLLRVFSLGLPAFLTEVSSGVVILVFNQILLVISGNTGVAAYGIIANLALIGTAVFTGIGQGLQPLASSSFGKGDFRKAKRFLQLALVLASVLGVCFYLCGLIFPAEIASVFNREAQAELANMAVNGIRLYFLSFLCMGINIVLSAFFGAVSLPKQAFAVSAARGFLAVLPLALILPKLLGVNGVWLVIPISELITLLVGAVCWRKTL